LATAYALLGPTASGKSALAYQLSVKYPVEIVSVDSAQVYRGMDIGTAKPSAEERSRVPHHLIDIVDPDESYSTGQFRADAIRAVLQAIDRKKIPLLVGGTMLYYRSLVEGLDALPPAEPSIRVSIDDEAARRGWPALHAELAEIDPQAASRIMPNDAQRIQRALEVFRITGKPISVLHGKAEKALPFELKGCCLVPERSQLHKSIEMRFDVMLRSGLVDEVKQLRARYRLTADTPSMRAVGYRQVWSYLEGEIGADVMRERALAATRQLAKRQITWLRSFPGLLRLDTGSLERAAVALELLLHESG
jgi:tRNA dimethylallyltransferase